MPTQTMLQHYAREVMNRAVYGMTDTQRVSASVPEIPELAAEGEDEREAQSNLSVELAAWLVYRLATGTELPVVGEVDLNSAYGQHMLAVEYGIEIRGRESGQEDRGEHGPTSDQAWFWTPEWQEGEREADVQIAAGQGDFFEDGDSLLAAMQRDHENWQAMGTKDS